MRISVRELEESQKMQILLRLRMRENRPSLTESTQTATNTQLETASTTVYEIKQTPTGSISPTYRNILLHHSLGFDFVSNELPLKMFAPYFEVDVFGKR